MKYQLVCLDIDGTLVTDEKELLPEVKESIRRAAKKGIRIALVSGRMPSGVERIEEELGVECIKICNAGTYILLGNQCLDSRYLFPETMKSIYCDIAAKDGLNLWIFRDREWYVTGRDEYIERDAVSVRYQPEIVNAQGLAERWAEEGKGPSKLLIAAEPEKIAELALRIQKQNWQDIDIARSADVFLEIFPKGVTKASAMETVCRKFGIPMDQVMAIGDQELDLPMIKEAGLGIAMGNAIAEVKAEADFVTKTNNEAGVAYALEKYL